eukprot:2663360-Prymnesium_polylepis.1
MAPRLTRRRRRCARRPASPFPCSREATRCARPTWSRPSPTGPDRAGAAPGPHRRTSRPALQASPCLRNQPCTPPRARRGSCHPDELDLPQLA